MRIFIKKRNRAHSNEVRDPINSEFRKNKIKVYLDKNCNDGNASL